MSSPWHPPTLRDSLQGLRVLDFSHVVAGPVCGMLLADLGADVTKIEAPDGELGRTIGPPWLGGESIVALSVNRNKRGLALDLRDPAAQAAVQQMAQQADVVLESFRPGVMQRLGLGHDTLRATNPRLVYCSISAYGQASPLRERPGVDGIIQAASGLMSALGEAGSAPCKVPVPIADMATGYLATVAVLAAVQRARRTGEGQHLDVSLYNATLMLQQVALASYLATGDEPARSGSAAPYAAPNEAYATRDGWIMVAAYQPQRWRALCELLDRPALAHDPRFATNDARVAHRGALNEELAPCFRTQDTQHWMQELEAADILCAPVAGYADLTASDQYRQSGLEITVDHPVAGRIAMPGLGIAPGDTAPHRAPPRVGEHSRQVLADYGVPPALIDDLAARAVLREAAPLIP